MNHLSDTALAARPVDLVLRLAGMPRVWLARACLLLLCMALLVAAASPVLAQGAADWSGVLEESVRQQFKDQQPGLQPGTEGLKIDIKLGQIDQRLQLAPCQKIEPFLPQGARLWGRSVIGVRCLSGANWSITVPVQVTVFGPALVAVAPVAAGSIPGEQDFRLNLVELTREPGLALSDVQQMRGRVMARAMVPGQVLRADYLRQPPVVNPGDPVKVKLLGEGFTLIYDGVAMNAAAEGQTIRVRGENGKIISGLLRDRHLEIRM